MNPVTPVFSNDQYLFTLSNGLILDEFTSGESPSAVEAVIVPVLFVLPENVIVTGA